MKLDYNRLFPTQKHWYDRAIEVAKQEGVPDKLFVSLVFKESSLLPFSPSGKPKVSSTGAVGLTQIQPNFFPHIPVKELENPDTSLVHGARLLKRLLNKYPEDVRLALAAYNGGAGGASFMRRNPHFFLQPDYKAPIEKWRHQTSHYVKTIFELSGYDPGKPLPLAELV